MKHHFRWTALGLALAGCTLLALAHAQAPSADPVAITADAGPWVICAASYRGAEASNLAHQLVEILRTRDRLPAFVFDRGDEERRHYEEEYQKRQAALPGVDLPRRHPRFTEQCAVLIGGYPDMEAANAMLPKIKKLAKPELKVAPGATAFDTEFVFKPSEDKKSGEVQRAEINPLSRSFVTRNPTAQTTKAQTPKFDPIWKELNASEPYSLLKNKKNYTLVVKEYVGLFAIQPKGESTNFLSKLWESGPKPGEQLAASGKQATELARFLRDPKIGGFETYVLHTRTSSIVTVGAFASLDDPELIRMQQRLSTLRLSSPKLDARNAEIVKLFAVPAPMEVPHF